MSLTEVEPINILIVLTVIIVSGILLHKCTDIVGGLVNNFLLKNKTYNI